MLLRSVDPEICIQKWCKFFFISGFFLFDDEILCRYILGSTGARKEALKLLIEKLQSVSGAIDFIQTEDPKDSELWEYLIVECLKFPERVSELLEHVGGAEYVEPIKLIRRIPEGVNIPHLRDRLVKIISDYGVVQSLREGCATILQRDCAALQERLYAANRRGVCVMAPAVCQLCRVPCVSETGRKDADASVVVFGCAHVFHTRCLLGKTEGGDVEEVKRAMSRYVLKQQTEFACAVCYKKEKPPSNASANAVAND